MKKHQERTVLAGRLVKFENSLKWQWPWFDGYFSVFFRDERGPSSKTGMESLSDMHTYDEGKPTILFLGRLF